MKTILHLFIAFSAVLSIVNCSSGESATRTAEVSSRSAAIDPNEALVQELNKQLDKLEIEGFEPNATTLSDKLYSDWQKKGIPALKEILPKVPAGYVLKVTGHADPYGGLKLANKVAEGRAKHIRGRVAKALGADGTKLAIKSYGAQDYEQEKQQSASKNRRVEFQIYKK